MTTKNTPTEPEPFDYLGAIEKQNNNTDKDNNNAKNFDFNTTNNDNQHSQRPNFRPGR